MYHLSNDLFSNVLYNHYLKGFHGIWKQFAETCDYTEHILQVTANDTCFQKGGYLAICQPHSTER